MAEFLWNGLGGAARAASAGVWARPGQAMAPFTATQLVARGADESEVAAFRSRPLTPAMIRRAEVVLCMEDAHRQAVVELAPVAVNKTFTVLELAELARRFPEATGREVRRLRHGITAGGIADPVNLPPEAFARTADELDVALTEIAGWSGSCGGGANR